MTEQIASTIHGTGAPSVLVEPGAHTSAGQPATLRVHARNLGDGPRDLSITVIGLDDGWAPEPVMLRDVPADMTVSAEAALVPVAGAVPGDYPFVVVVQALPVGAATATSAQQTTLVESHLTVDAPSQVLLTVEPADSRMRLRRTVAVVLSNTGGEPVDVSLSTSTEKGLRLELSERDVVVPARTTVRLTGRARNLRPQLMGHLSRRAFSVVAAGKQAPARFSGTITARPLLSAGFLRVMSLVVVMAMWAGGLVVALPWLTGRMTTEQTAAEGTADQGGPGSTPGAPGTPDAANPAAPDAPGDPADGTGSETEPDPTIRIGGVVTATDPTGVTVQIAPASIIPDASGGGGGAGGLSSAYPVPVHARLAAQHATQLAGEKDTAGTTDDGPLGKTAARSVALESTTTAATSRSTSTGDDGAWGFAGLSPNLTYLVTLSKPGYQTVRHVVSGSEAAAGLDVELLAGDGRLSGRVTGPDGAGAGGVGVIITDGTTTVTTSTATTGAVGSWSVDGLSTPSTYLVTAQGDGLGAQSRLVALSAGGASTADMTLSRGVASLAGVVSGPDSLGFTSGVGGARVTASDGTTTRTASTVTSGLVGSFTLVDLPIPGSYEITVEADGFATQTLQLALDDATSATQMEVALRSASGAVQGRITDTAGQALSSAGVTLHNAGNTYKSMVTSDGTFRLTGIEPGEYVVSATQFGHLTGYATVRASAGYATTVDLVLTEVEGDGLVSTSRIRGRVGDARTNGQLDCAGLTTSEPCLVTTTLTAQNADGTQRVVSVTSDPNAEYLIPAAEDQGLLPGLYVLEVSAPGYEPSSIRVSVPMDTTVTAGQVALFPSPSLTGTVLARVGSVPEGTCVIVVPSGTTTPTSCASSVGPTGTPASCVTDPPARCGLTGVNGGYTITNLRSGTYSASVISGDAEYVFSDAATVVTLAAGDVRRYDAVLNRLARISVTILINKGASTVVPAVGAMVTPYLLVAGQPDKDMGQLTANAQGLVSFDKLIPGRYRFVVASAVTTDSPVQLDGTIEGIVLGYNQELTSQLVLTNAARGFQGRVVTQLTADSVTGAAGVRVTLTGIVGFVGATPSRRSVTVVSDTDGYVTTQAVDAGRPGYLPVVTDAVDVAVDGGVVYRDQTFQNVAVSNTASQIELQPLGVPFRGTVTLTGATLPPGNLVSQVRFEVLSQPPGSGAVAISTQDASTPTVAQGRLVWLDLTQPEDKQGPPGSRMLRPGTYTVRASLAGFDPVEETFMILPGEVTAPSVDFDLQRFGDLRVSAFALPCTDADATAGCVAVANPVVTLRSSAGQRTEAAAPGQNSVDFGEIPSGTYRITVQAPGFVSVEKEIAVRAGQSVIANPEAVLLQQYGSITGRVTTTVGNSSANLAGVRITAIRRGPNVLPEERSFTTVSDADGRYQLVGSLAQPGLLAGTWEVTASLLGYSAVTLPPVEVAMGSPTVQDIVMTLGLVDLKVTVVKSLEHGEGIDGLTVQLSNPGMPAGATPCTYGSAAQGCAGLQVGEYLFQDVVPVQSTLEINGVAQGHSRLSLVVNPVLGQNPWVVTVPLVSMTNTVRGTVLRQNGAGSPVALAVAAVELTETASGAPVATMGATGADGVFAFEEIRDGSYTVRSTMTGYETVTRVVSVRAGQVAVLDLIMFPVTRQVTVEVESMSGSDLTGTLVGLATATPGANPASLSAQPLVRGSGNIYTTVFNQVPTGVWTATLSGAAGHPWTTSVAVADDEAAAVTARVALTEVAITLSATAPSGADASMEATITGTPSGAASPITPVVVAVPVGSGSRTVSLLAGSYTVTPRGSDGWAVTPAIMTIAPDHREAVGSFALARAPIATTTVVTAPPGPLRPGDSVVVTANVRYGTTAVGAGEVTFTLGGVSYGPVAVTAGVATQSVTLTSAMVAGPVSLTARFGGAPASGSLAELLPSSSVPVALTVERHPTTVAASAVVGVGTVTFTSTTSPGINGSVTVTAAGMAPCTSSIAAGSATCAATLPAGSYPSFTATFTPTDPAYATSVAVGSAFTVP